MPYYSETKIIDANNVEVLHSVIGDDIDGTVENVDGSGPNAWGDNMMGNSSMVSE